MTDQFKVDYSALFKGISAGQYSDGDNDLGLILPCGLGAKPVRLQNGRLTSEIDIQPMTNGIPTSGLAHAVVHENGTCHIPAVWRSKMTDADMAIISALGANIAQHPRSTF